MLSLQIKNKKDFFTVYLTSFIQAEILRYQTCFDSKIDRITLTEMSLDTPASSLKFSHRSYMHLCFIHRLALSYYSLYPQMKKTMLKIIYALESIYCFALAENVIGNTDTYSIMKLCHFVS